MRQRRRLAEEVFDCRHDRVVRQAYVRNLRVLLEDSRTHRVDARQRIGRVCSKGVVIPGGKGGADRPREAVDFRLGQDAPEDVVSSVVEFRLHSVGCFLLGGGKGVQVTISGVKCKEYLGFASWSALAVLEGEMFKIYRAACEAAGLFYGINSAALRLYITFQPISNESTTAILIFSRWTSRPARTWH